jgi:hypothetical protein
MRKTAADFYIINDYDCPEAECIARRRRDGTFCYVHPKHRNNPRFKRMTSAKPTPLSEFGIFVRIFDGIFYGAVVGESSATYAKDGKPRRWQGTKEFRFGYTS